MKTALWITGACAATLFGAVAAPAADERPAPEKFLLGKPFWSGAESRDEPLLFIQDDGQATATAKLLFRPESGLRIQSPDLTTAYVEGEDYVWKPGSETVELTKTSRIPFKTRGQMFPPPGSPKRFGDVLFSEGHFFHDLQVQATYRHADKWDGAVPVARGDALPRVVAKLKARQAVKLVALGDSVTEGYNASGSPVVNTAPFQPAFPRLMGNAWQEWFGAPVAVANLGKGGTRADWGISQVSRVTAEQPDVVLLAFGLNHSEPADAFAGTMRKLLDSVRAANPQAEVVLVSPMTGNPRLFPAERFTAYRDALTKLAGPGVAVADVTTVWIDLLKKKNFSDLSGNNVNHPNDFGHRVYAQVIARLVPEPHAANAGR